MREVKLENYVEVLSGYAFSSKNFNEEENGLPIIRIRDVGQKESETYFNGEYDSKYLIKTGDLLVAMDGEFRLAKWSGRDSLLNQRVCKIKSISDDLLDEYLYYVLPAKLKKIEDATSYVTVKHLSVKKINAIEVPLPSLSEQKAIVAKLDRAQRLIDIDREMLAKYDDLIQSVFLEMFGDPITNSKGWEVKKLGNLTTKVGSGSTPRGGSKVYQDRGIIFIRSQNVLMNKLDLEDVAHISDEIHNGMKNTWVEENDVLLNITGASIGRICIYNKSEPANVNQHVCILRPIQDKIKPFYLSHLLSSKNYQNKILGQQTGGTRQAFNMTQIKNFDIPLPPLEQQIKFHELLTRLKSEIQKMKFEMKKSEELFSSLVQGAFG